MYLINKNRKTLLECYGVEKQNWPEIKNIEQLEIYLSDTDTHTNNQAILKITHFTQTSWFS